VTVGDVASVEDSVKEPRSLSRWDNKNYDGRALTRSDRLAASAPSIFNLAAAF